MFNTEDAYLTMRRQEVLESLGTRHIAHPVNFGKRQTPPPVTAERLVRYHNTCDSVMQGGLRAFWRTLVSVPHIGREFERALAFVGREDRHA
jgi:hypothetical protein